MSSGGRGVKGSMRAARGCNLRNGWVEDGRVNRIEVERHGFSMLGIYY
jgi:hypothetical protein